MNKLIEMDELKKENKQLQQDLYIALNKIDKAIEYIEKNILVSFDKVGFKGDIVAGIVVNELLEILGDKE